MARTLDSLPLDPELLSLSLTPMTKAIVADDLERALKSHPFLDLPGALNPRDVATLCSSHMRPRLLYRTGALSPTLQAVDLHRHNIKRIFDLRSEEERVKFPEPELDGVETLWVPSTDSMMRLDPSLFEAAGEVSDAWDAAHPMTRGFMLLYEDILNVHTPSYRAIMEHVRDRPDEGVLFHCTAGKDRTGVLAALLQMLAEAPLSSIAADYTVTRVGIEPARPLLLAWLSNAGMDMSVDRPGTLAIGSVRPHTMVAFVELVEKRWGSAEGYCQQALGLTPEDVATIKRNLRPV